MPMRLSKPVALLFSVAVLGAAGCSTVISEKDAITAYATAVAAVSSAAAEDIDRCEKNVGDSGTAFCERAKQHFDVIARSAASLASSVSDGGAK